MAPTSRFLPSAAQEEKTIGANFIRDAKERPNIPHNAYTDDIPVVSLAGINDPSTRSAVCRSIVKACEEWGIFQLVDHGVDPVLVSEMSRLSREYFALPPEEKLRLDMTGGKKGGFLVSSHLQGMSAQDWREFFTFLTYPMGTRDYSRWPEQPSEWRKAVEEYSERLMELGCIVLEVLSEAMGLEKDALAKACVVMDQKVVVNFYPKCPQPELTLGLMRHTDPGTITLLLQDKVGGLQATKDGGETWIAVRPIEGAFVVNLGDHVYWLSNGRFKNADHRAVVNSEVSRLSIATFQNPAQDAMVYPLVVREGEKAVMEEPITYAEMYRRKFVKTVKTEAMKKMGDRDVKEEETNGAVDSKPLEEVLA